MYALHETFAERCVDLTQTLVPNIPNWDGGCGFEKNILYDYDTTAGENDTTFLVQEIKMAAGIGTHVDAPCHCSPGAASIADLQLKDLISPCIVVDVSSNVIDNPYYIVHMNDIECFETKYGRIPKDSFVVIRTGWDRFWADGNKYRNDLQFPSISEDVATYLVEAGVAGVGIDTLSPDCEGSGFPVHRIVLGAGKYIVENLTNLCDLPPTGCTIMVLPIKLQDCTEAPARVIAYLEK